MKLRLNSRMLKSDFNAVLLQHQIAIESFLEDYTSNYTETSGSSAAIASRYSLLGGGKRIRPILLIEVAKLYGVKESDYHPFAAAIEMIHTYSLIHDDLPAMDDDDLRRGQPSCHKKYGEATAILAGDLLLTAAFEIMLRDISHSSALIEEKIQAALLIAEAAGGQGMIAGQCLDLQLEQVKATEIILTDLQHKKTGALLVASLLAGAVLGKATEFEIGLWKQLGLIWGLIFQMVDDVLDFTSDASVLGKSTGKDERDQKSTFVTVYGLSMTKELIRKEQGKALKLLGILAEEQDIGFFVALNDYLPERAK